MLANHYFLFLPDSRYAIFSSANLSEIARKSKPCPFFETPDLRLICLGGNRNIGDACALAVVPDCAACGLHWPWQGKGFLLELTLHIFSCWWQFCNHNSDILRNSIDSVIRVLNDPFPQLATSLERSFVLWAFHGTLSRHRLEKTGLNCHFNSSANFSRAYFAPYQIKNFNLSAL